MTIDLYYASMSGPCRLVTLVAAAIDVPLNIINLNLLENEHLKPEFMKINSQHTVPTLVDHGFVLTESRSIARYLVNKYGGGSDLYPTEPRARALVDQRLDFDLGSLYPKYGLYFYPIIMERAAPNEALFKNLQDSLTTLNSFLEGQTFCAGDKLTLADLSIVTTIATIDVTEISLNEYPNILRWYELIKSTAPKYHEIQDIGLQKFKDFVEQFKAKAQ